MHSLCDAQITIEGADQPELLDSVNKALAQHNIRPNFSYSLKQLDSALKAVYHTGWFTSKHIHRLIGALAAAADTHKPQLPCASASWASRCRPPVLPPPLTEVPLTEVPLKCRHPSKHPPAAVATPWHRRRPALLPLTALSPHPSPVCSAEVAAGRHQGWDTHPPAAGAQPHHARRGAGWDRYPAAPRGPGHTVAPVSQASQYAGAAQRNSIHDGLV